MAQKGQEIAEKGRDFAEGRLKQCKSKHQGAGERDTEENHQRKYLPLLVVRELSSVLPTECFSI